MIAGRGTPDQAPARHVRLSATGGVCALIDMLVSSAVISSVSSRPARRGADFRHLGGRAADGENSTRWCIEPTARIVAQGARAGPGRKDHRISARRRHHACALYRRRGVDAVGLDWMMDRNSPAMQIQTRRPMQGNLDPLVLVAGGAALDRGIDAVLAAFAAGPSSSISATASCRRRRSSMSSGC